MQSQPRQQYTPHPTEPIRQLQLEVTCCLVLAEAVVEVDAEKVTVVVQVSNRGDFLKKTPHQPLRCPHQQRMILVCMQMRRPMAE